jgi:WD40 repeat protein
MSGQSSAMRFVLIMLALASAAGTASAQRPELVPQTGHGDVIDRAIFSPDGRLLATSGGYTVKLWAPATGLLLRTLRVETLASAMAFSPDSKYLVVGEGMGAEVERSSLDSPLRRSGAGYQIQFWDINTGKLVRNVTGHSFWVSDVEFSADGKWLATAGSKGEVLLRDGASGEILARLRGKIQSEKAVWPRVRFSPDGALLAVSDDQSDMQVWNVSSRAMVRDLGLETRGASPLLFTSGGSNLLVLGRTAGSDTAGQIVLWNLQSRKSEILARDVHGAVAISHDLTLLAVSEEAEKEKKIAFYDLGDGTKLPYTIPGYHILEFSPDDSLLVSSNPYVLTQGVGGSEGDGGGSPEVVVWQLSKNKPQRIPKLGLEDRGAEVVAYSVAVGDGGRLLARRIAGMTGGETLAIWDLRSNSGPQLVRSPRAATADIVLSPTSRRVALEVSGGVYTGDLGRHNGTLLKLPANNDSAMTDVLAFSPNEEFIARTGLDGKIRPLTIWNQASGNVVLSLDDIVGFAWFPDSTQFVAGDQEGRVQIRKIGTGEVVKVLDAHVKINAVTASPDGRLVAAGGDDGAIHVWDTALGQQTAVLAGRGCKPPIGSSPDTITIKTLGDCVTLMQFSPDGRLLAASGPSSGAPISVWDVASGALLYSLDSALDPTSSVDGKIPFSFTADSRFLIKGTRYLTIWDLKTGKEAALLSNTAGGDWSVITPDGYFDGSPEGWQGVAWRFGGSTFDVLPVEVFYNEFYEPGLLSLIVGGNAPQPREALEARDRRQPVAGIHATYSGNDKRHVSVAIHVCQARPDTKHVAGSGARDLRLFRDGSLVKHWNGDVLHGSECSDLTADVTLGAGLNHLTAYAFNSSDIKSDDAGSDAEGPDESKEKGIGYIISVGVDQYAQPNLNLRYAREDAQSFASEFVKAQGSLHNFSKTVTVLLLDEQATAGHIRTALSILAGVPVTVSDAEQALFAGLRRAQPEDGVFLFFAGHGMAVHNQFFLLPHDIAPELLATDPEHAQAISDADLGRLFEGIDGQHFLVVIDACRSGQALEAEEKRRGAMNSKGLAQLAYEKGMYILTASQAYQAAMETSKYGHGLLTFALLDLMSRPPTDGGSLYLLEWLEDAAQAVPGLQQSMMEGARSVSLVEGEESLPPDQRDLQNPRLFYRRDPDPYPLLIVSPPAKGD